MKNHYGMLVGALWLIAAVPLFGQGSGNCFLEDFEPKSAIIPPFTDVDKSGASPTVSVSLNTVDTLGKVSKYVFGNAVAVWVSEDVNNPVVVNYLQMLSPTIIRFPGGSWSDVYFWNGIPGDLPATILDGNTGQPIALSPQSGPGHNPTFDSYLDMRDQIGAQGLITVNYAYARYGLSQKPAEQAAHYAADWVRYDNGRTKFWEIGNESAGPWEAGNMIDTTMNKDGQPRVITGELYGKHFKIFADSMKAAAAESGNTIYIGGQILHYDGTSSWNPVDHKWNEGFFKEVGDVADFYVMHNYFGNSSATTKNQVSGARSAINQNIAFIRQDLINKKASSKPIAMTEWNCGGPDTAKTSIANGMQAVVLFCEMLKNNFGMSARWLVANWDKDGMFFYVDGNPSIYPKWNPRPDFYFIYYLQRFVGDHVVSTSVAGSSDVLAYASRFSSGHVGVTVVNMGTTDKVVELLPKDYGFGERYYVYSLSGVSGSGEFPQKVYVNDSGPTGAAWGPLDSLQNIPAWAYSTGGQIKFTSPARSTQFIMIEPGTHTYVRGQSRANMVDKFSLNQNYPNPFNPQTTISYSLPQASTVVLRVYNVTGQEIATLVHNEKKAAGNHEVSFNASNLPSGVYYYRLQTESFVETKKMVLIK